jgi:putative hydrolase
MAFWGDYHTHTVYSHGKSTLEQNVVRAIELGLKELGTADHGFKHMTYNVRRQDWPLIQAEHNRLIDKYPQIKLYLGLETNFVSRQGHLDIEQDDLEVLDVVVAGYHKYIKPNRARDVFGFYFPIFFANLIGRTSKRLLVKNTDAYIKSMEKYPIDVISHPQHCIKVDMVEVAKAAAHYGTYLELNGKRIKATTQEHYDCLQQTDVMFIANSDAHSVDRIGDFSLPLSIIERDNIPYSRIANWERLPDFRSRKGK